MATLTPLAVSTAATLVTYAAATAGGDTVAVGALTGVVLKVRNASGGSITVTIAGQIVCSQGTTHNTVATCAVGDTEIVIPPQCVNASGNATITYSASTSVTVAALDYAY